jgi:Ni2+-binding GTPase involved in maturation of urease and hydrogenase
MLDAQGIVTSIEEVTAEEETTDAVTVEEVTELMSKFSTEIKDTLQAMAKEITSLSSKLREIETGKFQAQPRKTNEAEKATNWKSLIAKK